MNPNSPNGSPFPPRPAIVAKEVSSAIIGCFFEAYNELGYGYLESVYARALEITLQARGLQVDREYPVVVTFRGERLAFIAST
jgi:GxxExxY protein